MKKTAYKNMKCEGQFCQNKAARKVIVNGTGGWNETHYFCAKCAKRLKDANAKCAKRLKDAN